VRRQPAAFSFGREPRTTRYEALLQLKLGVSIPTIASVGSRHTARHSLRSTMVKISIQPPERIPLTDFHRQVPVP
jgi:hypothetical protein